MSERTPNPSPLAGEVAARSAAGEGPVEVVLDAVGSAGPHPAARCARGRPLP